MFVRRNRRCRLGGIYVAVLSTALIVSLLAMTALIGQRLQNRMIVASAGMRQAQLNANSAVELGLLAMEQDANWRTTFSSGNWFVNRSASAGSCTLNVIDPIDGNLANNADDPIIMTGVGFSGDAQQRITVTIDPRKEPLSCLRSAVAVGDAVTLNGDTLRTNGLTTANSVSANASSVYGKVEAVTVSGSTYNGTTTQVLAEKRPTMPDWTSVFNYYRTNGVEINVNSLPTQTPNLGRNPSFDTDTSYWTGAAIGLPTATLERNSGVDAHVASCRVRDRTATTAGASQYIDGYVKSGVSYNISIQIKPNSGALNVFRIKLATKGTGAVTTDTSSAFSLLTALSWQDVSATVTAPPWSGELEYARVTIDTDHALGVTNDFYIDNLDIRENVSGRFIYRNVISPSLNPFGASTNSEGIYWINCNGNRLIIERSRILGTLLVVNPGANSCISNGPISWSPAVAGYPALLVDADTATDADFTINATNRTLNERENGVNFNPAGAAHEEFGQDGDTNDIYRSAIRGLVAVRDDLLYQNRAFVRGEVIVGDDVNNPTGELEVEFLPDSLLNPPPGFTAPYTYIRRPTSMQKAVLP
jgi:hypothetical protein